MVVFSARTFLVSAAMDGIALSRALAVSLLISLYVMTRSSTALVLLTKSALISVAKGYRLKTAVTGTSRRKSRSSWQRQMMWVISEVLDSLPMQVLQSGVSALVYGCRKSSGGKFDVPYKGPNFKGEKVVTVCAGTNAAGLLCRGMCSILPVYSRDVAVPRRGEQLCPFGYFSREYMHCMSLRSRLSSQIVEPIRASVGSFADDV